MECGSSRGRKFEQTKEDLLHLLGFQWRSGPSSAASASEYCKRRLLDVQEVTLSSSAARRGPKKKRLGHFARVIVLPQDNVIVSNKARRTGNTSRSAAMTTRKAASATAARACGAKEDMKTARTLAMLAKSSAATSVWCCLLRAIRHQAMRPETVSASLPVATGKAGSKAARKRPARSLPMPKGRRSTRLKAAPTSPQSSPSGRPAATIASVGTWPHDCCEATQVATAKAALHLYASKAHLASRDGRSLGCKAAVKGQLRTKQRQKSPQRPQASDSKRRGITIDPPIMVICGFCGEPFCGEPAPLPACAASRSSVPWMTSPEP
mmetsp:Transcript_86469/g.153051  ORF Transcript_86469/g.153051 Transcript_86469/m.153051 type:complete len:323 (-) Transcript_86469:5003-5971(-)